YVYLFPLVLNLDQEVALNYLMNYFFKIPIEANAVYHSKLPSFLYWVESSLGKDAFSKFIEGLPGEVRDHRLVKDALDELDM
ncbi:MAG: hypothetical protein RLZZ165_1023, partial [Bacteroidota bacterium]